MKNNKRNRILSLLIVMMMILAMLPAGVFADDEAVPAPVEEVKQEEEAPAEEEAEDEEPEEEESEDEVPEEKESKKEKSEEKESKDEEPEEEESKDEEPEEEESKDEVPEEEKSEDEEPEEEESKDEEPEEEESKDEVPEEEESEDEVPEEESPAVVDDNATTEAAAEEENKTNKPAPAAAPAGDEDNSNAFEEAEGLCNGTAKVNAIIRSEPVWNAEILLTVEEETDLKVLEYTDEDWYEVILDDEDCTEGYVYRLHVELEDEEEPAAEEKETPAPEKEKEKPVEEKNEPVEEEDEPDEEDDELTEIDDYETPLGIGEIISIELTNDADSKEDAEEDEAEVIVTEDEETSETEEVEITVTEDEETSEIEEVEVTVTEDEETSEVAELLVPGTVKIGAAVRTEPDGMSPIILTVTAKTALTVLSQVDDDWTAVLLAEEVEGYTIGYVYKDDIVTVTVTEPEKTTEPGEVEEEETEIPKKVTIFTSRRVVMEEGENVTLTSKLEGFDGLQLMYIWKVDKGEGFEEVEGANASTYTFEATAETLSWGWHLTVLYR